MVDIHCHIIPAVDDGVQSLDAALELIAKEVEGGTRAFIATPHINSVQDIESSGQFCEKLARVQAAVDDRGIDAKLYTGGELYASISVVKALQNGLPISLAGTGKYVLLDVPRTSLPMDFGAVVNEICSLGVTPILAHPERCVEFQSDPDRVLGFVHAGAVLQLNAMSFRGRYGEESQRLAIRYLKSGVVHFLASDAHRAGREPILGRIVKELIPLVGEPYVRAITEFSGRLVLAGQPLGELPSVASSTNAPAFKVPTTSLPDKLWCFFKNRSRKG